MNSFGGKKISRHQLPSFLPINFTACGFLVLHYFNVPGWAWGVWWTIAALIWIVAIIQVFKEEEITIDL